MTPAQEIAVRPRQPAVRVKPLPGVARQHFAPQIGVVGGRIAALEDVREVGGVVARGDRRIVESDRRQHEV